MSKRAGTVWNDAEYAILRRIWMENPDISPRDRAIIASGKLGRSVQGIMAKARECGLDMQWRYQPAHNGSVKVTGSLCEQYRLKSPEEAWRRLWLEVHGNRSYGSKPIQV